MSILNFTYLLLTFSVVNHWSSCTSVFDILILILVKFSISKIYFKHISFSFGCTCQLLTSWLMVHFCAPEAHFAIRRAFTLFMITPTFRTFINCLIICRRGRLKSCTLYIEFILIFELSVFDCFYIGRILIRFNINQMFLSSFICSADRNCFLQS